MASFSRLIRFKSGEKIYFSDIGIDAIEPPNTGTNVKAYTSLDDLQTDKNSSSVPLDKARSRLLERCRDLLVNW
jgi:hypothetical protein